MFTRGYGYTHVIFFMTGSWDVDDVGLPHQNSHFGYYGMDDHKRYINIYIYIYHILTRMHYQLGHLVGERYKKMWVSPMVRHTESGRNMHGGFSTSHLSKLSQDFFKYLNM